MSQRESGSPGARVSPVPGFGVVGRVDVDVEVQEAGEAGAVLPLGAAPGQNSTELPGWGELSRSKGKKTSLEREGSLSDVLGDYHSHKLFNGFC